MDTVIVLIVVVLGGLGAWGTISFWMDGRYRRNRPNPTLSGFRSPEDREDDR
ncbi:hypothetical protein [Nocardia seriolae]|nr:hypothetical protein [Nocardia seriolae]APA99958.1 hypothetical protein NS506_05922 [Nocardia seriolae]MTJ64643.1 hypothetical protein [Nocardia seriolae]MTJ73046.1 hypothetical protein [Nocardia seriolae]MTJ89485.1 hypothetical protein [Nocardia seriolae]MTK33461.1 hypothetical protein [Nocardia seriolae]